MLKTQVRELAKQIWLPNADRKDSQGLCFVGNIPMADFLKKKIDIKVGDIVLQDGTVVWKHEGAYLYTVGQRRGIWLHFQAYITNVDVVHNTITVSKDPEDPNLYRTEVGIQWIHRISWIEPDFPLHCKCKVRYRQELQDCTVTKNTEALKHWSAEALVIHFETPQKWVPNGQIAVLYGWENDEEVLGSGEIC